MEIFPSTGNKFFNQETKIYFANTVVAVKSKSRNRVWCYLEIFQSLILTAVFKSNVILRTMKEMTRLKDNCFYELFVVKNSLWYFQYDFWFLAGKTIYF